MKTEHQNWWNTEQVVFTGNIPLSAYVRKNERFEFRPT